ncbi:MAG: hypothetical protein HYT40_03960 [Candidatus Sungbacteria bacterium]|uniref:Uncharacterized protein n=1 Tax=Candidatus Sungiibacteriota bacterium TaxID=2750080 RepID=A0A931SC92_9BACT|nr:hypothetical protein [Candidatus Sungbacteria bacterium]
MARSPDKGPKPLASIGEVLAAKNERPPVAGGSGSVAGEKQHTPEDIDQFEALRKAALKAERYKSPPGKEGRISFGPKSTTIDTARSEMEADLASRATPAVKADEHAGEVNEPVLGPTREDRDRLEGEFIAKRSVGENALAQNRRDAAFERHERSQRAAANLEKLKQPLADALTEAVEIITEESPIDPKTKAYRDPLRYEKVLQEIQKLKRTTRINDEEIEEFAHDVLLRHGYDIDTERARVEEALRARKIVPSAQGVADEKIVSLDSHEARGLENKLGLALISAIRAAQAAAKRGEDPVDPLEDPKVKEIEDHIRQIIDPGAEDLEAVIRATENETLMGQSFNLEKLKAQAETVRAERDKVSPSATEIEERIKELKEAIEFGIQNVARTPFGRHGRIRNPLENLRVETAWKALEDAGVSEPGIRRLQRQFYSDLGFDWGEWKERVNRERERMNAGIRKDREKKEAQQKNFINTANLGAIADAVEQTDLQDAAVRALSRRSDYQGLADEEGEEMQRGGEISEEDLIRLQAKRDVDAAIRKGGGLPGRRLVPGSAPVTGKETVVNPVADKDDLELLREQEEAYRKAVLKREQEEEVRAEFYEGAAPESRPEGGVPVVEAAEQLTNLPRDESVARKELEDARAWLAEVERNSAMGAGELARATERYDKARAEYVAGDIHKFILEQTALFEKRAEITGSFEKVRRGWKWLGEMNLTKLGAKPRGFWSSALYRGVNVRSGVSGSLSIGLSGTSIFAAGFAAGALTPAGWVAMGVRQSIAAAGSAFLAYEGLRRRRESALAKLADDVSGLMHGEAAERMIQLAAYAEINHAWAAVRPAYEKLQERYEKDLEDVKGWLQLSPENVKDFTKIIRKEETTFAKEEWDKEKARRVWGLSTGALTFIGIPLIRKMLGYKEIAEAASGSRGSELSASEAVRSKGAAGALIQPQEAAGDLPSVREGTTPIPESVENIKEFVITVKPGEGPIHEARKAIALYLDKKGTQLDPAERIWAEEELWKRTKKTLEAGGQLKKVYHPGDSIGFKREEIDSVMANLKERFGDPEKAKALKEQLKEFTNKVRWNRYAVRDGVGMWNADEGIRKIVKVPVKLMAEGGFSGTALREAWVNAEEMRQFVLPSAAETVNIKGDTAAISLGYPGEAGDVAVSEAAPGTGEVTNEAAAQISETVVRQVSGLRQEYYEAIRGLSISELLQKRFMPLPFSKDQEWPLPAVDSEYPWVRPNKPSHVRWMDYMRFQNRVRGVLKNLDAEEAAAVRSMPVSKFIQQYMLINNKG